MSRMIVGLFTDITEAEETVKELVEGGFLRDDISVVAHRASCGPSLGPVESVSAGSSLGGAAAVGGLAGFVTGVAALAIPGIGPILAAGPIAAELLAGGVGATAGAFLSGLRQKGVSGEDAGCFCEALRRGGVLVTVTTSDERAGNAEEIIGHHRLLDIEDCATEWRQQGWKGFDSGGKPLSSLPFDPASISPLARRERRERRAVRSYVRIT